MRTRSPTRIRRVGPGTVPLYVHACHVKPGAISMLAGSIVRENSRTVWARTDGSHVWPRYATETATRSVETIRAAAARRLRVAGMGYLQSWHLAAPRDDKQDSHVLFAR